MLDSPHGGILFYFTFFFICWNFQASRMKEVAERLLGMVVIFTLAVLGSAAAFKITNNPRLLGIGNCLSAGILFAAGLLHGLPESAVWLFDGKRLRTCNAFLVYDRNFWKHTTKPRGTQCQTCLQASPSLACYLSNKPRCALLRSPGAG